MQNLPDPPEVTDILSRQVKNPASARALRRLKTPYADVKDEKKRQELIAARRKGGQKSQQARRKSRFKGKGVLMRRLNAYRTANKMDHPNAIALQKKLAAMG